MNGASGGTGWAGNWTGANWKSVNTYYHSSGISLHDDTGATSISRSFGDQASGTVTVYIRWQTWAGAGVAITDDGGNQKAHVYCNSTWRYFGNGGYTDSGVNCSAATWYPITIGWDDIAKENKVWYQFDGGTPTSWVTVNGGTYTYMNSLKLSNGGDWVAYSYFDTISGTFGSIDEEEEEPETATSTAATTTELVALEGSVVTAIQIGIWFMSMLGVLFMFKTLS